MPALLHGKLCGIADFNPPSTGGGRGFRPCPLVTRDKDINRFLAERPLEAQESLPTPWSAAEIFRLRLLYGDAEARDEWGGILHHVYFGRLHQETLALGEIEERDPELATALSVTPCHPDDFDSSGLVYLWFGAASGLVPVAGAHPSCLVFPAQDRSAWLLARDAQAVLQPVTGRDGRPRLSLRKLLEKADRSDRERFLVHLAALQRFLAGSGAAELSDAASKLLKELGQEGLGLRLKARVDAQLAILTRRGTTDPMPWLGVRAVEALADAIQGQVRLGDSPAQMFLAAYPLVLTRGERRLVLTAEGLDPRLNDWVGGEACALGQVSVSFDKVRAGSRPHSVSLDGFELAFGDEVTVVPLGSLLLDCHWAIDPSQLPEMNLTRGFFKLVSQEVLPVRRAFFGTFPLDDPALGSEALSCQGDGDGPTRLWSFPLPARGARKLLLRWRAEPLVSRGLLNVQVEMWPPRPAPGWPLFFLRFNGVGTEATGAWRGFSADGSWGKGEVVDPGEVKGRDYVQVLRATPRGLSLCAGGNLEDEKGVFLLGAPDAGTAAAGGPVARIAIDFGTSNTSVAVKHAADDEVGRTLGFDLRPVVLWEKRTDPSAPPVETLGWFPRRYSESARQGVFPTRLWARGGFQGRVHSGTALLEAIFQADLPGLKAQVRVEPPSGWYDAGDLKWGNDASGNGNNGPRSLFLKNLLLRVHAQLAFGQDGLPSLPGPAAEYAFTYPLSMNGKGVEGFEEAARQAVEEVSVLLRFPERNGPALAQAVFSVSESAAMAKYVATVEGKAGNRMVVVDVGGGSTDFAICRGKEPACLDSVRLAGARFFSVVSSAVRSGGAGVEQTKQAIGTILQYDELMSGRTEVVAQARRDLESYVKRDGILPVAYTLLVNAIEAHKLPGRERTVAGTADASGQLVAFLVRGLFRQLLGYGMVLAAADVLEEARQRGLEKALTWSPHWQFSLVGNGWGLVPFAGKTRQEVGSWLSEIWSSVRAALVADLDGCQGGPRCADHTLEAQLLERIQVQDRIVAVQPSQGSAASGREGKTAVALGAAVIARAAGGGAAGTPPLDPRPFFGVSMRGMNYRVGRTEAFGPGCEKPTTDVIHWYDRLSAESLHRVCGFSREFANVELEPEAYQSRRPLHPQQKTCLDLMRTGGLLELPVEEYVAWNDYLHSVYAASETGLFPIGKAKGLELSPLRLLLEHLHLNEKLGVLRQVVEIKELHS